MSLISAAVLAARIDDPTIRIVDARWYLGRPGDGRDAYEAGHIPGAIFVDMDTDLVAPTGPGRHPLPSPAVFAARLGELGIESQHEVVVYDDVGGWVAARLWWMLDDLGHPAVSVLDGGYQAWVARDGALETGAGRRWPAADLALGPAWTKIVDRDELRSRLGQVVVLDARAGPRYRGEVEPIDPVAGHIPTARNAPTAGNLDANGAFLSAGDLRLRFEALGAAGDEDVVNSCGSGVSACHNALAMRIAGLPDPILYAGSYSDWSSSGYPVATGPGPGELPA
jgi:thiosulfate/3-mercaptopyruvate sulfurtransferase